MKVTFKECHIYPEFSGVPEEIVCTVYQGEIIGTTNTFFSGTQVQVACIDGKIREVSIDKCTIANN